MSAPLSELPGRHNSAYCIDLVDVTLAYEHGGRVGPPVLEAISLHIQNEIAVVIGANGAGKSTLIAAIAGLVVPTAGRVSITAAPDVPESPRIALLPQAYRDSNLPWLTVHENITAYAPGRLTEREHVDRRGRNLLDRYVPELDPHRYPYQTSGGQQQAIAVLRAIMAEPSVFLADEPLSAIDQGRNWALVSAMQEHALRRPGPIVWASHNIDEAILLADRIVLLSRRLRGIAEIIDVQGARPRSVTYLKEPDAIAIHGRLIDFFLSESDAGTSRHHQFESAQPRSRGRFKARS